MYELFLTLIEKGNTNGLAEKASKLHQLGQLTDDEYAKLIAAGVSVQ